MLPEREPVSPIIEKYHPNASLEEKIQMTEEFRNFLGVLYDIFCRMEKDGRMDKLMESSEDASRPLAQSKAELEV